MHTMRTCVCAPGGSRACVRRYQFFDWRCPSGCTCDEVARHLPQRRDFGAPASAPSQHHIRDVLRSRRFSPAAGEAEFDLMTAGLAQVHCALSDRLHTAAP